MTEKKAEQVFHPYGKYIIIWLGLVNLTLITVSVAGLNLAGITVITALVIATVKSSLVLNYFMHIKHETMIFKLFIALSIIVFFVMIILTFFDIIFRP
ncbi:MAG TPA: cytochrome C oxidase subunit IV family protein [Ignavibacteria bacterium]|nr:cytochrome C oxidase subunit IV family protein [Ignavibacteria bacterium]